VAQLSVLAKNIDKKRISAFRALRFCELCALCGPKMRMSGLNNKLRLFIKKLLTKPIQIDIILKKKALF